MSFQSNRLVGIGNQDRHGTHSIPTSTCHSKPTAWVPRRAFRRSHRSVQPSNYHNTHSSALMQCVVDIFHFHLNSIYIHFFSIQAYILILDFPFYSASRLICGTIHILLYFNTIMCSVLLWCGYYLFSFQASHFSRKRALPYRSSVCYDPPAVITTVW